MRAPEQTIHAPPFPRGLRWLNVAPLRMDRQRGRPVLVEFWDFCRVHSLRTLPYVRAWHERYAGDGLRVVSVHAPGFPPGRDEDEVAAAVGRLGIEHPVCLDTDLVLWREYGNEGWPARYLFDGDGALVEFHYGEGAYRETELAIGELLGVRREPLAPLRPEDDPEALLVVPTAERPGPHRGPYEAGGAWAVVSGRGVLRDGEREIAVEHPGCVEVVRHERHTAGTLDLRPGPGVTVHATSFTPGLAP